MAPMDVDRGGGLVGMGEAAATAAVHVGVDEPRHHRRRAEIAVTRTGRRAGADGGDEAA